MRYHSVDIYRGATVAFMIIVNAPGTWEHVYAPLRHAEWHGCTPTDLVFPSFMFIIGVSMWFSFERYGRRFSAELGWKILKRTALLFLIGLILNNFPLLWKNWDTWRIMGVPQRLALGYGFGALLVLWLDTRRLVLASIALLLGYWGLLSWFGVSGADPYGLESNAVLRLDRWLFTDAHLWHGERIPFDPEGVLSTIPAVVTVILGWLSGNRFSYHENQSREYLVRDLLLYGIICASAGLLWDLTFPINKKLWTSSYVLYAGGLSMVLLALSVWVIDVRNWRNGTGFFLIFGTNPLFAYVLSEALMMTLNAIRWENTNAWDWLYNTCFAPVEGGPFSSFLFALVFMLFCWWLCRWLYVRKWYIKI